MRKTLASISVDLARILVAHGERRRQVGAEWGGVSDLSVI